MFEIGEAVYGYGNPRKPGLVVNFRDENVVTGNYTRTIRSYQIRWLDKSISWWRAGHLKSMDRLIEDHLRKAEAHTEKLARLHVVQEEFYGT